MEPSNKKAVSREIISPGVKYYSSDNAGMLSCIFNFEIILIYNYGAAGPVCKLKICCNGFSTSQQEHVCTAACD